MADKNTDSPLSAAAVKGHELTVHLLVEHGADVDTEDPSTEALRRGRKKIAKLPVEKGANVNPVQRFDLKDGIPFRLYILPTNSCLAQVLVNLFAISNLRLRPKKRDATSKQQEYACEDSPLCVAAASGDEESFGLLLHNGANPKKQGACAMTP